MHNSKTIRWKKSTHIYIIYNTRLWKEKTKKFVRFDKNVKVKNGNIFQIFLITRFLNQIERFQHSFSIKKSEKIESDEQLMKI